MGTAKKEAYVNSIIHLHLLRNERSRIADDTQKAISSHLKLSQSVAMKLAATNSRESIFLLHILCWANIHPQLVA